jgi:hypothetical protein
MTGLAGRMGIRMFIDAGSYRGEDVQIEVRRDLRKSSDEKKERIISPGMDVQAVMRNRGYHGWRTGLSGACPGPGCLYMATHPSDASVAVGEVMLFALIETCTAVWQ